VARFFILRDELSPDLFNHNEASLAPRYDFALQHSGEVVKIVADVEVAGELKIVIYVEVAGELKVVIDVEVAAELKVAVEVTAI
jgi:hypothetical protein